MSFDFTPISNFYEDQRSISSKLLAEREISLQVDFNSLLAKSLTIVAASCFEHYLKSLVIEAINDFSSDVRVRNFAYAKGIDRQYHTWFGWKDGSVNTFFALFGRDFSDQCRSELKSEKLKISSKNFIDIGRMRNEIIHDNFITFSFNNTAEEIYEIAKNSIDFLDYCAEKFVSEAPLRNPPSSADEY